MVSIDIKIKGDLVRDIRKMEKKLKTRVMPKIVNSLTKSAWASAQNYASRFQFDRTLRRNIGSKRYSKWGMVYVKPAGEREGLLNELGPSSVSGFMVKKRYKSQVTPKLRRWMDRYIPNARNITVGGANTRFGTNKFIAPAYRDMQQRVPLIVKKELRRLKI